MRRRHGGSVSDFVSSVSMARHAAPSAVQTPAPAAAAATTLVAARATGSHRAHAHRAGPPAPVAPPPLTSTGPGRHGRPVAPLSTVSADVIAEPIAEPVAPAVEQVVRMAPARVPPVAPAPAPVTAPEAPAEQAAAERVRVPRVLLETLAWVAFAAVVALVVIGSSDASLGRAALWAGGLGGIVVAAVAVLALTGTRLEDLNRPVRDPEGPD